MKRKRKIQKTKKRVVMIVNGKTKESSFGHGNCFWLTGHLLFFLDNTNTLVDIDGYNTY